MLFRSVKLHTILSVTGASRQSVRMTSERRHENRVLKIGDRVKVNNTSPPSSDGKTS